MATLLFKRPDGTYGRINQYLFNSIKVALEKGQSLVDVMSQRTVTDELNRIDERIDDIYIPSKVSEFENDMKYQTEEEVTAAIKQIVGAAPEALDTLEEIASKLGDNDDLHSVLINLISEKANSEDVYVKDDVYNREEIDTILEGRDESLEESLSEVDESLQSINDSLLLKAEKEDVYTKDETYTKDEVEVILYDYLLKKDLPKPYDDTAVKERLTAIEGIDHTRYLTRQQLDGYARAEDIPDVSIYATKKDLTKAVNDFDLNFDDYYNKREIDAKISEFDADHTNYYTKAQVDNKFSSFDVDLSNYYTKKQVDSKIANIDVDVDLSNYYTKKQVDAKIANIPTGSDVNLDGYVTKEELASYDFVTASDIITQEDLDDYFNESLDNVDLGKYLTKVDADKKYATKEQLNSIVVGGGGYDDTALSDRVSALEGINHSQYALKSEIPNTSNLATKTQLQTLSNRVDNIQATESYDDTALKARISALENIDHSQYITLSSMTNNYYNKTQIENKDYAVRSELNNYQLKAEAVSIWSGTQAQYDAISNKDSKTVYIIC